MKEELIQEQKPLLFFQKISFQIAFISGISAGVLVLLSTFSIASYSLSSLKEESQRHIEAVTKLYVSSIQPSVAFGALDDTQDIISELAPKTSDLVFVEMRDLNGEGLMRWTPDENMISLRTRENLQRDPPANSLCLKQAILNDSCVYSILYFD